MKDTAVQNSDKQKTLADLSVAELKAIAYDQVVQINKSNEIIRAVEAEIARRGKATDIQPEEAKTKES